VDPSFFLTRTTGEDQGLEDGSITPKECLLYMDDIIVPGATFEENLQRLKHTLDRLLSAGLKLKPSKCVFFQTSVKFLGHMVNASFNLLKAISHSSVQINLDAFSHNL
jgi:hypothetical protein